METLATLKGKQAFAEVETTILEADAEASRLLAALIWRPGSSEHRRLVARAARLEQAIRER
jgi:hypothetical protein